MQVRPRVFRPVAVERYGARRDGSTLPRLRAPHLVAPTIILLFAACWIVLGAAVVAVPGHAVVIMTSSGADTIVLTAPPDRPPHRGQRVFLRRRADGLLVTRGAVVRVLPGNRAEARIDAKVSLRSADVVVSVETEAQPILKLLVHQYRSDKENS